MLPVLSPLNTTSSLTAALTPLLSNISYTFPDQFFITMSNVTTSPTFYDWWSSGAHPNYAGIELFIGSRLIGAEALLDTDALETALKGIFPSDIGGLGWNFELLGGKGLADVVPRGGSDAVNPAWRRSLIHASSYPFDALAKLIQPDQADIKTIVTGATWTPLDNAEKAQAITYLTNTTMQYLRVLDPDSGAYVNEADPNEPNWQQAFWGSNYERLLKIKRRVDPEDVFWCQPCVGSEGWELVGDTVCMA